MCIHFLAYTIGALFAVAFYGLTELAWAAFNHYSNAKR